MTKGNKISKNVVPENFTMGLAIFDAVPVALFGISMILIGQLIESPLFIIGSILCIWAGTAKVIWKIIVVQKHKNVWWLFKQLRIFMPIGFTLGIVAFIINSTSSTIKYIIQSALEMPMIFLLILGLAGFVTMIILAAKLGTADIKSNWIEQLVNVAAQFSILLAVVLIAYGGKYYKAQDVALKALNSTNQVNVEINDDYIFFEPKENAAESGFIIYPGAKVEFLAYAPLAQKLAENGISCAIVQMPVNMALFGQNKANEVISAKNEIKKWYIGGHSLGGVMASYYAAANVNKIQGVILLASYSTKSLENLRVLSIYGEKDGVINLSQYEKYKSNLPSDFEELVITGGNHAGFADYGFQSGDNEAAISKDEQVAITADAIIKFIHEGE